MRGSSHQEKRRTESLTALGEGHCKFRDTVGTLSHHRSGRYIGVECGSRAGQRLDPPGALLRAAQRRALTRPEFLLLARDIPVNSPTALRQRTCSTARHTATVPDPRCWSADAPRLAGTIRHVRCRAGGSAEQLLQVPGIGPRLCDRIRRADEIDVDREIHLCGQHEIDIIPESDPRYPRLLREIPDPPGVLFWRGDCQAARPAGAGHRGDAARHALRAEPGRALGGRPGAGRLDDCQRAGARHRCRGPSRGVEAGGRTIAVLGSGVLNVYPPEHAPLGRRDPPAGHGAE